MLPATAPLVRIEGAWFMMGSDNGKDDERPIHRVWVDTFEIGAWQVTNEEFAVFQQSMDQPRPPGWDDPRFNDPMQPVIAISWFDAVSYCHWLGRVTGRRYRLPTEAEWECAARGGVEGALYPWGDDPPQARPDHDRRWLDGPERRASGESNRFGLCDVCENVHEWCGDWYQADYYAVSPDHNPRGPTAGTRRVSRGGSWRHRIKISRCAARSSIPPTFRYADYGFRIACEPE